jgi:hypothetical protein
MKKGCSIRSNRSNRCTWIGGFIGLKSQILQRLEPSEAIEQLERLEQALTS